jgi:zinc-binding alcohol dehydrogenase family protein
VAAGKTRVLGYDGVGEVVAVGEAVTEFAAGDRVYYAGHLSRSGSNAEFEAIDARLVAKAPQIRDVEAAALPLTFMTAFELLHDKFGIDMIADGAAGKALLVINGAGGVGSIMIQLAKWLGMTVIATASRAESIGWVKEMGADVVVSHRDDYVTALREQGFQDIPNIAILHATEGHIVQAAELVGPFGHVGAVVEPASPLDVAVMKNKSASLDWEFMFAKYNYQVDVASQGAALALLTTLVDEGHVRTTLTDEFHGLTAENILAAQKKVATGSTIGKIGVEF